MWCLGLHATDARLALPEHLPVIIPTPSADYRCLGDCAEQMQLATQLCRIEKGEIELGTFCIRLLRLFWRC